MLGLALGAAVGCPAPAGPAISFPGREVIRTGVLEDRFLLTGEVRAVRAQPIVVPRSVEGITRILWMAPEGVRYHAGEPVVRLDDSVIRTGLEDKRLALVEAEKELQRARAEVQAKRAEKEREAGRRQADRDKAKLEAEIPETLRSRREHGEKRLALEKAEAALAQATRRLETLEKGSVDRLAILSLSLQKARRAVKRAEAALEEYTLRVPVDGILIYLLHPRTGVAPVVDDEVYLGQSLAEVPEPSDLEVEARLSDVDDGKVLPGTVVRCTPDAFPDRVLPGRVVRVSGAARRLGYRSGRRFFVVAISLAPVHAEGLWPGMSVKVEVLRRRWENARIVPRSALDLTDGTPLLRLERGPPVAVALQGCDSAECALAEGPPEGTAVGRLP